MKIIMDLTNRASFKRYFLLVSTVLAILAIDASIIWKLLNLFAAFVSAIIGILLGLYITVKAIDHAIFKYIWNGQNGTIVQGSLNSSDVVDRSSHFASFSAKIITLRESVLRGLSKSLEFHYSFHEMPRSMQNIHSKIMSLGRSAERISDKGTYVCVSQNIDMMMNRIFEYTLRDYVETWYTAISNDRGQFHKLVKADFWEAYRLSSQYLAKVDIINLVMNRYIKTLTLYFKNLDATDPVKKNYAPFHLHPCLKDSNTEREFLRRISEYIIRLCLPRHVSSNSSSRLILREILAGLVFMPLVDAVCDPDNINLNILAYMQQRETAEEEKTRAYTYAATYEDFIRIINNAGSISELQQIRRHIMTELMHATAVSSLKKDDKKTVKAKSMAKGELLLSRDLKRYINQCQVARQQCEKRIRLLGGERYANQKTFGEKANVAIASSVRLLSFSEVMSSPMARSYFLKYMKKIEKSSMLKFWNEVEIIHETGPTGKDLAKIISHIYQTYILPGTSDELPLEIDKGLLKGMQNCVVGNKSPEDFFKLQEQVCQILEKDHFPSFVVSDFYICQLMPQLSDGDQGEESVFEPECDDTNEKRTAAFGSRKSSSDGALKRLKDIEDKLEYKAQALESLKPVAKHDSKLTKQLEEDIASLQKDKLQQQLHIERTETWWSRMGSWNASIDSVSLLPADENHPKVPVYSIIVICSGVPLYEVTDDVSGWVVGRNLDEFKLLHQSIKDFRPWLKKYRLPSMPVLSFGNITEKFLEKSKVTLNEYLKRILEDEILSRSELVYSFLSQPPDQTKKEDSKRKGLHRRSSVSKGFGAAFHDASGRKKSLWQIGDILFTLPKDILDSVIHSEDDLSDSDEAESDENLVDLDSIAGPLYELISEVFEIQGLFRPLRKTLIIFVRLAFGGTINKQIRDTLQWLVSEPMVVYYLQNFLDTMWPDGQMKPKTRSRTEEDKIQTALEAQVKFLQNIPEVFQNLIGNDNTRRGFLKIFQSLQEKQLNKHLFYNLLSESVEEVFPEILKPG